MIRTVVEVVEEPALTFTAVGPAGEALWAQVFSGLCRIDEAEDATLKSKITFGSPFVELGFYVPQAGPFRPSYRLSAWAEVSLANVQIRPGDGLSHRGPYGVDRARVQFVEGKEGIGSQWPYLSFTALGGRPMLLRYRVTITQPAA